MVDQSILGVSNECTSIQCCQRIPSLLFLLCFLLVHLYHLSFSLPLIRGAREMLVTQAEKTCIRGIIYYYLWTMYLWSQSTQVDYERFALDDDRVFALDAAAAADDDDDDAAPTPPTASSSHLRFLDRKGVGFS